MAVAAFLLSLFVAIVLSAAIFLAVKQHKQIISRLDSLESPGAYPVAAYSAPLTESTGVDTPAEYDLAGAWAHEAQMAGFHVSAVEVERQRAMRMEAGL